MSQDAPGGKLAACLVTCFTTIMSRTNAASCSPRSEATSPFVTVRVGSCRSGGHEIWWTVEAETNEGALAAPFYVASAHGNPVQEVEIP